MDQFLQKDNFPAIVPKIQYSFEEFHKSYIVYTQSIYSNDF